jgi:diguanylate cyclase (GGDEF)-like protein
MIAALSPLVLLAATAAMTIQLRHTEEQRSISHGLSQTALISNLLMQTQLDGHSLGQGLRGSENERLERFVQSEIDGGRVTRFHLFAPDYRMVYGSEGLPGASSGAAPSPDRRRMSRAMAGQPVAALISSDQGSFAGVPAGDRPRSRDDGQVVEIITALHNTQTFDLIGAMEVQLPYEPAAGGLDLVLHGRLYVAVLAAFALVYFVLAGAALRVTGRLARSAARFQHQAFHDGLTDLPNRALLADRILDILRAEQEPDGGGAVVMIDLNRFQEINDALGHRNGDLLLSGIADRLSGSVRTIDTVARLGGDEFALLLPGVRTRDKVEAALWRVRAAIEQEVTLNGLPLHVDSSLGVAFIPQDGTDPDDLLRHAEVAMHVAKRSSRGSIVCYDSDQEHSSADDLAIAGELRRAVERNELVLHYQPQVHQPGGHVQTLEALVRWQHPTRGLLGPDVFVPIAEQTSLIDDLTGWVLTRALSQLKQWRTTRPELAIAVNISARSLHDLSFPETVQDILYHTGATPDWLLLEITETALVADAARASLVLGRLSGAGLRLSLDDFGQGYTSLSQLSVLPFNELKIDKSFVMNMEHKTRDAAIVRAVIDLAHNLGLDVVAEGVENATTLQILLDLGCDITQGYHVSRPLPAEQVMAWLAAHAAATGGQAPAPPAPPTPLAMSVRS